MNILPAIVGAALFFLLALPILILLFNPVINPSTGYGAPAETGYEAPAGTGYGRIDERISGNGDPSAGSAYPPPSGSYPSPESSIPPESIFYDPGDESAQYEDASQSYQYELTAPLLTEVNLC